MGEQMICPHCGGRNGVHGLVHVRYGNGGGGNLPCPEHHPCCYQVTWVPDDLPSDLCDCRVLRMIDAQGRTTPGGADEGKRK